MAAFGVFKHSRFLRFFALLVLILVLAAVGHLLWTRDYVRSAYQASVEGKPVSSLVDHTRHDLDYDLHRVDLIFWHYIFFGIPLTILFWSLLWKMLKALIAMTRANPPLLPQPGSIRGDTWIALGLYSVVTVIYFFPSLATFNTAILGPPGDNMAGLWSLWWGYDMSLLQRHPLSYSNYLYFPEGSSLYYFAWSFYNLGLSFLFQFFTNQVAAFNLVMLHGYPIAGLGAFLLVRRLTGNSLAAIVSGFIFAFSPTHFLRSQHHIHINTIQFIPFFVMYFIDAIRDRTKRSLALAALFFLLNTLGDWSYMIMAGYFLLFGYLYLCLKQRRWWLPDYLVRSAIVVLCTVIVLSPWLWGMIKIGISNPEVDVGGRNTYVTDALALVVPGTEHWASHWQPVAAINASYTGNATESANYLGIFAIAVVVFAFRRTLRESAKWWLGMAAFTVMSLGPQLHILGKSLPIGLPYTLIAYVPFLSNVRAPARFIVYVYLFWSILLGLGLNELLKQYRDGWRKIVVTALLPLLLFVDFLSICSATTEVKAPECLMEIHRNDSGSAILNLPLDYLVTCRCMMEQTLHELPIVQGAATRKIGKSLEDRLEYSDLAVQKDQLVAAGVKYIVIHNQYRPMQSLNIDAYRAGYELVSEDNDCIVLRVY